MSAACCIQITAKLLVTDLICEQLKCQTQSTFGQGRAHKIWLYTNFSVKPGDKVTPGQHLQRQ